MVNVVGRGKNAGNQHSLLFQQCYKSLTSSGSFKLLCVQGLINRMLGKYHSASLDSTDQDQTAMTV